MILIGKCAVVGLYTAGPLYIEYGLIPCLTGIINWLGLEMEYWFDCLFIFRTQVQLKILD